jgi:hypothetical protein
MKILRLLPVLIFLLFTGVFAQSVKYTEISGGMLAAASPGAGFLGGIAIGRMIDESVGFSIASDIYYRSRTERTLVSGEPLPGGGTQDYYEESLQQSTLMLPIFFQLQYHGNITQHIVLRVSAGAGYEFLWNKANNYALGTKDTNFFSGFGWHADAGISIPASSSSDFFATLSYHGGAPTTDTVTSDTGLPSYSQVDMSGFALQIGLRLYNFGF